MSKSAWCDLNIDCSVLKLPDMCHNPKCNCEKKVSSTPRHFQREGARFKNTMEKSFKGSQ